MKRILKKLIVYLVCFTILTNSILVAFIKPKNVYGADIIIGAVALSEIVPYVVGAMATVTTGVMAYDFYKNNEEVIDSKIHNLNNDLQDKASNLFEVAKDKYTSLMSTVTNNIGYIENKYGATIVGDLGNSGWWELPEVNLGDDYVLHFPEGWIGENENKVITDYPWNIPHEILDNPQEYADKFFKEYEKLSEEEKEKLGGSGNNGNNFKNSNFWKKIKGYLTIGGLLGGTVSSGALLYGSHFGAFQELEEEKPHLTDDEYQSRFAQLREDIKNDNNFKDTIADLPFNISYGLTDDMIEEFNSRYPNQNINDFRIIGIDNYNTNVPNQGSKSFYFSRKGSYYTFNGYYLYPQGVINDITIDNNYTYSNNLHGSVYHFKQLSYRNNSNTMPFTTEVFTVLVPLENVNIHLFNFSYDISAYPINNTSNSKVNDLLGKYSILNLKDKKVRDIPEIIDKKIDTKVKINDLDSTVTPQQTRDIAVADKIIETALKVQQNIPTDTLPTPELLNNLAFEQVNHTYDDIVNDISTPINTPDYEDILDNTFTPDSKPDYLPNSGNPVITPSIPTDSANIDFHGLNTIDLKEIFPFCIPFDLVAILEFLNREPIAPHFVLPFVFEPLNINYTFDIDFKDYEVLSNILRSFLTVIYIVALLFKTRDLIRG